MVVVTVACAASRDAHASAARLARATREPAGPRSRPSRARRVGFTIVHDTSPTTPSESTPGRLRSIGDRGGLRARAPRRSSATPRRITFATIRRLHPLPGSASRIGASTAATMARRQVGTGNGQPWAHRGVGTVREDAVEHAVGGRALELELGRAAGCGGASPVAPPPSPHRASRRRRPDSHAHAFAACSIIAAPRGETPSVIDGDSRVARVSATMYASTAGSTRTAAISSRAAARHRGAGDRAHTRGVHVVGVEPGVVTSEHVLLLLRGRVADDELEQEAVELGFGQRVRALVLHGVLGGDHDERIGERDASCRRPRPGAPPSLRAAPPGSSEACG